ncbi:transposable element Tcb1 transposase [Trichonephila clavipes]|uniref:Transposable element Tcb1 transposase n=1 Tax=Trichonephila clavipes TaxID=2585209 RepID=A0A8X6SUH2_TRICX|nr:transposable element Tcb1 transposase [Trichonephila clavipes]
MQEGTTDRRGRSHPPQCNTSQQWSVLKTSIAWSTLDAKPQSSSTTNGVMKEGCGRHNGMRLSLLTSHASFYNTTMVGFESGNTVGKMMLNSFVMHHHTGPAPGIMGLATDIFQQDNARPYVARIVQRFFVNHQIELLPWPARSPDLSPIENMIAYDSLKELGSRKPDVLADFGTRPIAQNFEYISFKTLVAVYANVLASYSREVLTEDNASELAIRYANYTENQAKNLVVQGVTTSKYQAILGGVLNYITSIGTVTVEKAQALCVLFQSQWLFVASETDSSNDLYMKCVTDANGDSDESSSEADSSSSESDYSSFGSDYSSSGSDYSSSGSDYSSSGSDYSSSGSDYSSSGSSSSSSESDSNSSGSSSSSSESDSNSSGSSSSSSESGSNSSGSSSSSSESDSNSSGSDSNSSK